MITKQQFDSLFSDNITRKQYDTIIQQIDERFGEICEKFLRKRNKSRAWYDYGNLYIEDEYSEGHFDPDEYKEYIEINGEWIEPPAGFDFSFPTRWLWEADWEKEMKKISEDYETQLEARKAKEKKRRETRQQQVELLKASIKAKLTPEELKIVKFTK